MVVSSKVALFQHFQWNKMSTLIENIFATIIMDRENLCYKTKLDLILFKIQNYFIPTEDI